MRWQAKWSWSLVWLILALALLTTAAYALYRYLSDPGLQAVQDAGLFTDVNTTSEPNVLTPQAPFASGTGMAVMVDRRQTQEGIDLTLDWVYLEDARQAVHVTASGLGPDRVLGIPQISFPEIQPEGYSGAIFSIEGDQAVTGTYLVYQFITANPPSFDPVDMRIDVPILARAGASEPLTTFHFDLSDVALTIPWGGGGSNAYAVTVNGIEMRMPYVIFAPDYTQVRVCYTPAAPGDWSIGNASAQFGDAGPMPAGAVGMQSQSELISVEGDTCRDITFPVSAPGKDVGFFVQVDGLRLPGTSKAIDSTWQFSSYLPGDLHIGGIQAEAAESQAPLASETIGDLTATLQSAYMDSNRMAFSVHFDGWQEGYSVGNVRLLQADGSDLNVGAGFGPDSSDAATTLITLTPAREFTAERFTGQLLVDLNTTSNSPEASTQFTFDIDLPVFRALSVEANQTQTANGIALLLQQVKVTPSYTVAYVCYRKPSPGDWGLGDETSLQIGSDSAGMSTYTMLYDTEYGDVGKGPRTRLEDASGRGSLRQGRLSRGPS